MEQAPLELSSIPEISTVKISTPETRTAETNIAGTAESSISEISTVKISTPETRTTETNIAGTAESNTSAKERSRPAIKVRPAVIIGVSSVILVIALIIGIVISTQHSTSQSPTPAKSAGQWVTIQTLSGTGYKKTSVFTVSNNWRIIWSCDLASHNNTDYVLFIHAYTTTNVLLNNSIETTCSATNTHSFTQITQGGKVYLSILSEGSWNIQIQTMK